MRLAFTVAAFAALFPNQAMACERDSFAVQFPGETNDEFEKRATSIDADQNAYLRVGEEKFAYSHASSAYIGRVISAWHYSDGSKFPPTAIIRPLKAIKGALPTMDRTLVEQNTGGLCSNKGDGSGTFAGEGELVLVFEGLPTNELRPNGIYSLPAQSVRTNDLLVEIALLLGVADQ